MTENALRFLCNLQTGHQVNVNMSLQFTTHSSVSSNAGPSKNKCSFSYIMFAVLWCIPRLSEIMVVCYSSAVVLSLMVSHELKNVCISNKFAYFSHAFLSTSGCSVYFLDKVAYQFKWLLISIIHSLCS